MITRFPHNVAQARNRRGFTLIELMVVVGIVALLITMAATSFGGASRQESVTKSRNQLRDLLLFGRQQACVTGKEHVLVCWNVDVEMEIGNSTQKTEQGRYALFRTVGPAWASNTSIVAPFGYQREVLAELQKNARAINMNDPDDEDFMRVKESISDPTQTGDSTSDFTSLKSLTYTYYVGGQKKTSSAFRGTTVAIMRSSVGESEVFPLGIRTTSTYSLPQNYKFSSDREVFVFTPDGGVEKSTSISAVNSVTSGSNVPTFTIKVNTDGSIDLD